MKFKLFGNLDCPDWFLSLLATVSTISTESALSLCKVAVDKIYERELDWDSVDEIAEKEGLDLHKLKEVLGCLHSIAMNSTRFGLSSLQLSQELTMLGLPKEISDGVAEHLASLDNLRARLVALNPKKDTIKSSSYKLFHVPLSSTDSAAPQPVVQLNLKIGQSTHEASDRTCDIEIPSDKLRFMRSELMSAYEVLQKSS
eukprot:TRINITY_DN4569_c0_g2_i1.p1 TRINITY_DN4569_c0_g2~~TRINITY_DN4569_c0_g2_i1.p1  ORF type:complete len:200 (+),score=22.22 TRINITY_DN4569_c0_g2_i1:58-657(+)